MQRNLRWWMPVVKQPNWNALCGPMQSTFIEPLASAARAAGARLLLNRPVTNAELIGTRVSALWSGAERVPVDEDMTVVSALPVEVLKLFLCAVPQLLGQLTAINSPLVLLQQLETAPLSALDLHLAKRIDGLPPGHFILRHSKYDITGIDITGLWDEYKSDPHHPTVLQIIVGEPTEIACLPDREFARAIVDDLSGYFPLKWGDVDLEHTTPMKHLDEPLFMNNVGSNSRRVDPTKTGLTNLYLAGDHAETEVDLASMEGAVYSGLTAAQAICEKHQVPAPAPLELKGLPDWLVSTWKVVRYPLAAVAWPLRITDPWYWGRDARAAEVLVRREVTLA